MRYGIVFRIISSANGTAVIEEDSQSMAVGPAVFLI